MRIKLLELVTTYGAAAAPASIADRGSSHGLRARS
jgi:hypothetical protein